MRPGRPIMLFAVSVILIALLGCNLPSSAPAEPTAVVVSTPQNEAEPPTPQPETPTETPAPTETATPAPTATMTLTLEPSSTPTTIAPMANIFKETNCRSGPGQMYDRLATFQADTRLEIVAADLGGGYWYVKNPQDPSMSCWLWGNNAKIEGDTSLLPKFTPPPSPTPSPDFDVTFKNFDTCKRIFARFIVVNTGGFQFRSAYVKVTDQRTGEVTEQAVLAFDLTVGCVVAKNISPLTPGSTGYLQSVPFKKDPRGHKLHAVFMLCTEQGLGGTCMTKTLEVKP
jgi:hypothetical protein